MRKKIDMMNDIKEFIEKQVFDALPSKQLFNFYRENNVAHDLPDGNQIRRENLLHYLDSFESRPSMIVVGEAPGHKGLRFSGIPFTSEVQLVTNIFPFSGKQSSRADKPKAESTATIFWETLLQHHQSMFVWNSIPFHPFSESKGLLSNRTPSFSELEEHSHILNGIIGMLGPKKVVAVGRSAENLLSRMDIPCEYIMHPSYGNKTAFKDGMEKVFGH